MKFKIGKTITINYEFVPWSMLTGYKISCWFFLDKEREAAFYYWEPNSNKLKNGLTKQHKEIIKNFFIGNFTDFYLRNVKW